MNSIKKLLQELEVQLQTIYSPREALNISKIILEDAFNITNVEHSTKIFSAKEITKWQEIKAALLEKKPWQYVLGQADFYGLKLAVTAAVLIPRAETEELVYWIKEEQAKEAKHILDIGTGSGCIAIALYKNMPFAKVTAVDIAAEALLIAQKNAKANLANITFEQVDILNEKDWGKLPKVDIIVSNPPYITPQEKILMSSQVLDYEPSLALFVPQQSPLLFYEKIADFALEYLQPKGWLYFEINEHFGAESLAVLQDRGFVNISLQKDFSGKDRMLKGQLN